MGQWGQWGGGLGVGRVSGGRWCKERRHESWTTANPHEKEKSMHTIHTVPHPHVPGDVVDATTTTTATATVLWPGRLRQAQVSRSHACCCCHQAVRREVRKLSPQLARGCLVAHGVRTSCGRRGVCVCVRACVCARARMCISTVLLALVQVSASKLSCSSVSCPIAIVCTVDGEQRLCPTQ